MISQTRNWTRAKDVVYTICLYFDGLSLWYSYQALSMFVRSHIAIRDRIQKYKPQKLLSKKRRILKYIVEETLIRVGWEYIWLWVTIEPENNPILALNISKERNMYIAEKFISSLVEIYKKPLVSVDRDAWYLITCKLLWLKHHVYTSLEKTIIKRTITH